MGVASVRDSAATAPEMTLRQIARRGAVPTKSYDEPRRVVPSSRAGIVNANIQS